MKLRLLVVAIALFGMALFLHPSAKAAEMTITPEKIELIKARCTENLATLNRLHKTDAFLRTDRGNLYRTISDKLMVPLNRRIASTQLDGGALLTITADYNREYNRFYDAYIEYDNAVSKILEIDCNQEPVAFYTALVEAREKRSELSSINQSIRELIRQYGELFVDFKNDYESNNR